MDLFNGWFVLAASGNCLECDYDFYISLLGYLLVVFVSFVCYDSFESAFFVEFDSNAKDNVKEIVNASYSDFYDMMEKRLNKKFDEDVAVEVLWNNYLNNELLNKYMKFRRVSKWEIQKKIQLILN